MHVVSLSYCKKQIFRFLVEIRLRQSDRRDFAKLQLLFCPHFHTKGIVGYVHHTRNNSGKRKQETVHDNKLTVQNLNLDHPFHSFS